MNKKLFAIASTIFAVAVIAPSFAAPPAEKVSYVKQVVPILKKNCYSCHNKNQKTEDLDLTSEKGIRAGGEHGKIVVPKKSGESRIMGFIKGLKGYDQMPPDKKLKDSEIKLIAKWIDEGLIFDKAK